MSIRFRFFGIPKTIDEFLKTVRKRLPTDKNAVIWIEEKADVSGLIPETAHYYERIVVRCDSIELRLPWKPAGGYYGTFPADGYLAKLKQEGIKGEITRHRSFSEIAKIADLLKSEGIDCTIKEESETVFGLRKFI